MHPLTKNIIRKSTQADTVSPQDIINQRIGRNLGYRRKELGLTLAQVSNLTGLSYQQIQKYERGHNSMTAAQILNVAIALKMPVEFLFRGTHPTQIAGPQHLVPSLTPQELARLQKVFSKLRDQKARKAMFALMESMADLI